MSGGLVQSLPSLAVNRTPAAPAMSRRSGIDRTVPFRWALTGASTAVTPSTDAPAAQLWFLPELVTCAALVLARSGGGELVFVGRSLDSVADLLDAALESVPAPTRPRVHRLPLSFRPQWRNRDGRPTRVPITPAQRAHLRDALRDVGAAPTQLARRGRPVTFVDVVHSGETFTELFAQLADWVQQQQVPWPIVRRRLRFVGVTSRTPCSPKTERWHQGAGWTGRLPGAAIRNVSLDPQVWCYLGNTQRKAARSFPSDRWGSPAPGPSRSAEAAIALADAQAIVAYGRGPGRRAIARAIRGEPALRQRWLRDLVTQLSRAPPPAGSPHTSGRQSRSAPLGWHDDQRTPPPTTPRPGRRHRQRQRRGRHRAGRAGGAMRRRRCRGCARRGGEDGPSGQRRGPRARSHRS